jgi:hypothetical protein
MLADSPGGRGSWPNHPRRAQAKQALAVGAVAVKSPHERRKEVQMPAVEAVSVMSPHERREEE